MTASRPPKSLRPMLLAVVVPAVTVLLLVVAASSLQQSSRDSVALACSISLLVLMAGAARWRRHAQQLEEEVASRTSELAKQAEDLRQVLAESDRQRRELEAAKRDAEEAAHAKAEFLANTSHELRTPLNGILGLAEIIHDTELSAEQRELLQQQRDCAETLYEIINDILEFSKLEAGKLQLESIEFPTAELLGGALQTVGLAAAQKGVRFVTKIHQPAPESLVGDPVRIRQVILNLASNAMKFTAEGSIEICIYFENFGPGRVRMQCDVRDTGIGIKQDRLAAIFESFSQEDGSTTRRFGGTGLGLTICQSLIELMSGVMGVESQAGRGSRFWFAVELGVGSGAALPDEVEEPDLDAQRLTGVQVLLVEDNRINRVVAERVLRSVGVEVTSAIDGQQALEAIDQQQFDLILMDCQMPVMDGFAATARIRAAEVDDVRVPIIALTANALDGDRERCLAAGMDDYLAKPFKRPVLLELIDRWIDGSGS